MYRLRSILFFLFLGLLLSGEPKSVLADTPTPPVPTPTAACYNTPTSTSMIPTAEMGTPVIGTPVMCGGVGETPVPCTVTPTLALTGTPTMTVTPTVTPTPSLLGMECIFTSGVTCWSGQVQTYVYSLSATGFNNNVGRVLFTILLPSEFDYVTVYWSYTLTTSWTGADYRYAPGVEEKQWISYEPPSPATLADSWQSPGGCQAGSSGSCVWTEQDSAYIDLHAGHDANFQLEWKNYNIWWPAGSNTISGNMYISIVGFPVEGTVTPTVTPTGTPSLPPCGVDGGGWITPPYVRPGACYVLIPGGTWTLPDVTQWVDGLPTEFTIPGFTLCVDYLVFDADLFGTSWVSIAVTAAFMFSLTLLYREFRS